MSTSNFSLSVGFPCLPSFSFKRLWNCTWRTSMMTTLKLFSADPHVRLSSVLASAGHPGQSTCTGEVWPKVVPSQCPLSCVGAERAAWKPPHLGCSPLSPGRARAALAEKGHERTYRASRPPRGPGHTRLFTGSLTNQSETRNNRRICIAIVLRYTSHLHWVQIFVLTF